MPWTNNKRHRRTSGRIDRISRDMYRLDYREEWLGKDPSRARRLANKNKARKDLADHYKAEQDDAEEMNDYLAHFFEE